MLSKTEKNTAGRLECHSVSPMVSNINEDFFEDFIAIEWWFQMVVYYNWGHQEIQQIAVEFTREMIPNGFSFLRLPWWHNYLVAHLPKSCLSQLGSTWRFRKCSQVSCVIRHAVIYSTICVFQCFIQLAIEVFHKWGYPMDTPKSSICIYFNRIFPEINHLGVPFIWNPPMTHMSFFRFSRLDRSVKWFDYILPGGHMVGVNYPNLWGLLPGLVNVYSLLLKITIFYR